MAKCIIAIKNGGDNKNKNCRLRQFLFDKVQAIVL
jgi:hypothetical protein